MRSAPLTTIRSGINRLRTKGGARPDVLYDLLNGYVTESGTVRVRPGTARMAELDPRTRGLCAFEGQLHTFCHIPVAVPEGYVLNVLAHPDPPTSYVTGTAYTLTAGPSTYDGTGGYYMGVDLANVTFGLVVGGALAGGPLPSGEVVRSVYTWGATPDEVTYFTIAITNEAGGAGAHRAFDSVTFTDANGVSRTFNRSAASFEGSDVYTYRYWEWTLDPAEAALFANASNYTLTFQTTAYDRQQFILLNTYQSEFITASYYTGADFAEDTSLHGYPYNSVYANDTTSIGMSFTARDLAKGNSGLLLSAVGNGNQFRVWSLSTAYDVTTASVVGTYTLTPVVNANVETHQWSPDGTHLYLRGWRPAGLNTTAHVWQYDLSTPWDVSTATFVGTIETVKSSAGAVVQPAFCFTADGTRMFYGRENLVFAASDLSIPWDITTAVDIPGTTLFTNSQGSGNLSAVALSPDGTRFYAHMGSETAVYALPTPNSIAGASKLINVVHAELPGYTVAFGFALGPTIPTDPAGTTYSTGEGPALRTIHFSEPFLGALYVAAEFEDDSVYHYWLQKANAWQADTMYDLGDLVFPTTANGIAYVASRVGDPYPQWQADEARFDGLGYSYAQSIVEPSEYTGYCYVCVAVDGPNPRSGTVEPTWPTSEGGQVTERTDTGVPETTPVDSGVAPSGGSSSSGTVENADPDGRYTYGGATRTDYVTP